MQQILRRLLITVVSLRQKTNQRSLLLQLSKNNFKRC
ncbi:hypothetical protein GECvBBS_gp052 [Salmonella phage GEC_vB_BS]|uniref:Uncharacterized protein n=3 Tax=Felixounavirus mushroom TaxID=1965380 RepID=A0A7S9XF88_9CAUD|nr:hypothetical protein GECvBB1_gp052 [Salmonella phage GEC_vB_B1]QPI14241.1 hypothetical protein GECvBBS_gp052 [Salmonella phage GEC_vB_BS]QPI15687.1 hypothetical protein GECvBNS7_gp052 [Salmonella phage GEC_vB_NS7]